MFNSSLFISLALCIQYALAAAAPVFFFTLFPMSKTEFRDQVRD